MSMRYSQSFYMYMQCLICWFRISNSIDTITFKTAQHDEHIKFPKPKRLSIFYSTCTTNIVSGGLINYLSPHRYYDVRVLASGNEIHN